MRSTRLRPLSSRWCLIAILFACAGCIQRTVHGDVSTYGFETWIMLGTALAGVVAAPVGWLLRRRIARLGYGLLILGPVAVFVFVPVMWRDRVIVDSNHFERSSAMPGSNNQSIPFDGVVAMHYHSAIEGNGRRSSRKYYLDVTRKDGQFQTISLGTLLQAAIKEILTRSAAKGIKVSEDHQ